MTVKLLVLYGPPQDPAAFDEHYFGVHMPLVAQVPGLLRSETGRIAGKSSPYYRVTGLYFADRDTMNAGLGSPEGAATAADYQQIAPPGSQMLVQDLDD
jgi:uncharacterized protein (TIGR02118 family)